MGKRRSFVLGALLMASSRLLAQQPDTATAALRVACAASDPAPRMCALRKAARRLQAAAGLSDSLIFDADARGFRVATLSGALIPGAVEVMPTTDSLYVVVRAVTAPTLPAVSPAVANASVAVRVDTTPARRPVAAPSPAQVRAQPDTSRPAAVTAKRDTGARSVSPAPIRQRATLAGPVAATRLVIGGPSPQTITARLKSDTTAPLRITGGRCRSATPGDAIDIVGVTFTDGQVTCRVRLLESATADRPYRVVVEGVTDAVVTVRRRFGVGQRSEPMLVRLVQPVAPVVTPMYAVLAVPSCQPLAQRVRTTMAARGLPVVSEGRATRKLLLEQCERVDRVPPLRSNVPQPTGWYIAGVMEEPAASPAEDAPFLGMFQLTFSRPNSDPMAEATDALVARLLKYQSL